MSGNVLKAKRVFERTVATEPNYALAHAALATCHFKLLEDETAERCLARALALGPEVPDVRWANFVALMLRGDLTSGWRGFEFLWRSRLALASCCSFPLALLVGCFLCWGFFLFCGVVGFVCGFLFS